MRSQVVTNTAAGNIDRADPSVPHTLMARRS